MKAYITSIGEVTTELCYYSLVRQGFAVTLIEDPKTTLAEKLSTIYEQVDEDFIRVDADIIINKNLTIPVLESLSKLEPWWWQFKCFDWFQQKLGYGGVQFYKREALPALRHHINDFMAAERPETELSRIPEFYNPRRFDSCELLVGLNNYKNDIERVKETKDRRGQSGYDWDMVVRLNQL